MLPKASPCQRRGLTDPLCQRGLSAREVQSAAFMCRYARSNTRRGVESCGILAGLLDTKRGLFSITTLIVPKQEGTSDTVQALAEEEIFDVQDKRGLYPMGWIHTHPTQTCFLSSIDVHTQCGYQVLFPFLVYAQWWSCCGSVCMKLFKSLFVMLIRRRCWMRP